MLLYILTIYYLNFNFRQFGGYVVEWHFEFNGV